MEIKFRGEKFRFSPFRIVVLLVCIYLFYLICPYWFDKLQVLTANEKSINWIPKEIINSESVWGNTLSQKHNVLILPFGKQNFTVYYDTEYLSISGFWSAIPKVSFSEKSNIRYTTKTIDPVSVDQYSGATAERTRKVQPYLKISIDSNKELLHKVVNATTVLQLEFPQKKAMSFSFENGKGSAIREFKLLFVSPQEYVAIKKKFKEDMPESTIALLSRVFISVLFLTLIILNIKSLFKKVSV